MGDWLIKEAEVEGSPIKRRRGENKDKEEKKKGKLICIEVDIRG